MSLDRTFFILGVQKEFKSHEAAVTYRNQFAPGSSIFELLSRESTEKLFPSLKRHNPSSNRGERKIDKYKKYSPENAEKIEKRYLQVSEYDRLYKRQNVLMIWIVINFIIFFAELLVAVIWLATK